jgi:ABC-2 type transport system ATP-binding protein
VIILHKGEIIRQGTMDELTKQRGLFLVGLAAGQTFPKQEATDAGYTVSRRGDLWEVGLTEGQSIDGLLDLLRSLSLNLRHLEEKHQTLEDIFLETVEAVEPVQEPRRRRKRYDN